MPINPDASAVKVSRPLTNVSIAYLQAVPSIAEAVFPTVPVRRQGDLYYKYNRGDWMQALAEKRAPATESAGGGWTVGTDSYYADVYAVHKDVDDQLLANADELFNIEADAARWVAQQLQLRKEILWHENFFTTAAWSGSTGAVGTANTWDTGTGATSPVREVRLKADEIEGKTGLRPNTLVVDTETHEGLLQNPDILDRIKYTQTGQVTAGLLASMLDVDRYIVSRASYSAAGSDTLARVATAKQALLVYAAPNPGLNTPSAGYTFSWTGLLGAGAMGLRTKRFRMEEIESTRVEAEMAFAMKMVATDLGYLFTATV